MYIDIIPYIATSLQYGLHWNDNIAHDLSFKQPSKSSSKQPKISPIKKYKINNKHYEIGIIDSNTEMVPLSDKDLIRRGGVIPDEAENRLSFVEDGFHEFDVPLIWIHDSGYISILTYNQMTLTILLESYTALLRYLSQFPLSVEIAMVEPEQRWSPHSLRGYLQPKSVKSAIIIRENEYLSLHFKQCNDQKCHINGAMKSIRGELDIKVMKRCLGIIKKNKYAQNESDCIPCKAVYCSKRCQWRDWRRKHKLICQKSKEQEQQYRIKKQKKLERAQKRKEKQMRKAQKQKQKQKHT